MASDPLAVLYNASLMLSTFNLLTLSNMLKIITNFSVPTAITGYTVTMFNGSSCTSPCYMNYTTMDSNITFTTVTLPRHTYTVHFEGLLTIAVINPQFTLQ